MSYEEKRREIDLMEYWRVIVKRKWVIVTFAGILVFITGVFSFLAVPLYKSTVTLLMEEESSKILSIDETFGYQPSVGRDLRFYNTQIRLLKSKSLAERVARKMNLLSRPEFGAGRKSKKSMVALAKDILTFKWIKSKKKSKDEKLNSLFSSSPYSSIARSVQSNIEVESIRDTKLVEVSFTSPSPILAAETVNTLAKEFINFSIEKRYATTQQASDFLSEQIANLREELATKERELQRYGQEKEILLLNDTESTALNKFDALNQAYTQAQIERIRAEANYRELKDLNVDSLPHFVNNSVVQQLHTEYTRLKNEYKERSKEFKPNYPDMVRLKARLDNMEEELRNEIEKAVDAAESQYRTALKNENSLRKILNEQKIDVARMDSDAILYRSLKIEVENKRRVLNSLEERKSQTEVSASLGGLKSSNISIIDPGEVPRSPFSPKKTYNLTIALLIGIFGGAGLCFFLDYLDNTVKGPEDVEKLAGLSSIGIIPFLSPEGTKKKKKHSYYSQYNYSYGKENPGREEILPNIKKIELVNHLHPKFFLSEDYRTVRTSILLSHAESPPKSIVFSSPLPREGKTATVVNMAVAFAQLKEKVLVVDSDLRKPRLHRIFKVRNNTGLSAYLTGKVSLGEAIQKTSIENIWILPSGLIPPNPSELLNSKKMKEMMEEVKKRFDIVFLDTTPVLAVIDAVIVSSLADSTVLVIKAGKITRKPFLNTVDELRRAKAKIIGVLFNQLKVKRGDYYFMDYYRYYRQHYYGEEEKQKNN